jgi:hypothetical protein
MRPTSVDPPMLARLKPLFILANVRICESRIALCAALTLSYLVVQTETTLARLVLRTHLSDRTLLSLCRVVFPTDPLYDCDKRSPPARAQ